MPFLFGIPLCGHTVTYSDMVCRWPLGIFPGFGLFVFALINIAAINSCVCLCLHIFVNINL